MNNVVTNKIKILKISKGRKTKMMNKINEYSILAYEKGRSLKNRVTSIFKQEEGQGMVEYALIIGLVSVVAVVALTTLGSKVTILFKKVTDALTGIS
jgi:pilus assembly protein Flp/PilA